MAPPVLLLLLFVLLFGVSSGSLPRPRTSFLLNSAERPLLLFSRPDIHNTTTLLLSDDGSTLYVGARDAVLSLDVSRSDAIGFKKKVEWRPSRREIDDCQSKGKNATVDCPNFVSVLQQMNSSHLYACGSFAFSPHDVLIDAESLALVRLVENKAKVRCPFSPAQKSAALAVGGELFTATTTDFRGVKPQISRHFSKDGRQDVSQDTSVTLLHEPTFVSSWSDASNRKLYFFFSEVGKEFSFVDELQVARVAQVCQDDVGGQRTLQSRWTSFAKAPLLCRSQKQLPFNVLQHVFTLPPPEGANASDTLFYGVFTSQWSTAPESAVCVFRLQDVRTVFAGSYRTFDTQTQQWSPMPGRRSYLGQCGLDSATDLQLAEVKRSFLTSGSVQPLGGAPVVVSSGQRYTHVTAMRTPAANGRHYTVLFLLTDSGFLHKLVPSAAGARVVEEIQVFAPQQPVRSVVLSPSKGVLYVGTSGGVTAVPVSRCSVYASCSQCVLARDPLCGWSRPRSACSPADATDRDMVQDVEDGNVGKQCGAETRSSSVSADTCPGRLRPTTRVQLLQNPLTCGPWTEVGVRLNAVVRLRCLRPSNLASVSWTSPRFKRLPEELFLRAADGSLSFLASADTFGTYHCEAEEGGYKEVVASYAVLQLASPRSISPEDKRHASAGEDETYEDILTETPTSATRPGGGDRITTDSEEEADAKEEESGSDFHDDGLGAAPNPGTGSWKEPLDGAREKSYYGELVVVSLLLATCVCVLALGGLHTWRRRRTALKLSPLVGPEDGAKTSRALESVPSLEDAGAETKLAE